MSESKLSSQSLGRRNVTLHIWPSYSDLLSFDVSSVAALLFLQLTIPGQFSLIYSANPDLSPTGQLPFLVHGLHHVSGLASIIAYVRSSHNAHHLDAQLSAVQHSQLTARVAHVESAYGDLVNHMLYSLQENWANVTRPALLSMLPVPQRYYVSSRIRTSHKTRLEAAELWHVPEVDENQPEEPRRLFGRRKKHRQEPENRQVTSTLEREKVTEKVRAVFDVYSRLLGDRTFFSGSETPTTLDVVFAAHTYFLLNIRFPDNLVTAVLLDSYPRLIAHSEAVVSSTLPKGGPFPPTAQDRSLSSLRYMVPWLRAPLRRKGSLAAVQSPETQKTEWTYRLWRWGFIGASILAVATYLHFANIVIVIQDQSAPAAGLPPPAEASADPEEEGSHEDVVHDE